jgi:hypothetical protein
MSWLVIHLRWMRTWVGCDTEDLARWRSCEDWDWRRCVDGWMCGWKQKMRRGSGRETYKWERRKRTNDGCVYRRNTCMYSMSD